MTRKIAGLMWDEESAEEVAKQLDGLVWNETSGVRNPAHGVLGFAVIKSADVHKDEHDPEADEFVSTLADLLVEGVDAYKDDYETTDRIVTILDGALTRIRAQQQIGYAEMPHVDTVKQTGHVSLVKAALNRRAATRTQALLPGEARPHERAMHRG